MLASPVKFCVITTPRSGSTWLSTMLESHPEIKCLEEPFIWRADRANWKEPLLPTYYQHCRGERRNSYVNISTYLDLLVEVNTDSRVSAVGFKVMYNQLKEQPKICLKLLRDRYRIIHLVRHNYIDILISRYATVQHKIVHSHISDVSAMQGMDRRVVIDTNRLLMDLNLFKRNNRIIKRFLKFCPALNTEVSYEEMLTQQDLVLEAIFKFLDVNRTITHVASELKKLRSGSYRDKIKNYEEVLAVLSGTEFEVLLAEDQ